MSTLSTEDDDNDDEATVHCHDCGMIASSPEEARAKRFCHVKVFDVRRLLGGDEDRQKATGRLEDDDGYYWLCSDCFHHMLEALPVVGGDFDKFSHRC